MRWNLLSIEADILAVHAALLHTGEILFFTGNEFWGTQHDNHLYDHVRLFNCQTLEITKLSIPDNISDLFCCGHAFFGNGNLLMAGGSKDLPTTPHFGHSHWFGERRTWMFDVTTKKLTECASLNRNPGQTEDRTGGRWYPTLVTLGSGQILAVGGHPDKEDYRHSANAPEYFEWNSWRYAEGGTDSPINFDDTANPLEYPRLHLVPDGKVFSSTPFYGNQVMAYELNVGWRAYPDLTPDNSDWRKNPNWVGPSNNDGYYEIYNKFNGTSVLLPLIPEDNYEPRVMVHGNMNSYVINLSTDRPSWQKIDGRPIGKRRLTVNSVILPTGEIFFCGGVEGNIYIPKGGGGEEYVSYCDDTAVNEAEIYNPFTGQWILTPAAQVVRNYHSVALLMPDGRVWTAGSSKDHAYNEGNVPPNPDHRERRIEIFEPWYYGLPTRPKIKKVITDDGNVILKLGCKFTVLTDEINDIARVAIIRNGSVTHGFNSDQRYIGLTFTTVDYPLPTSTDTDNKVKALRISVPVNPNIVVPGHYMLFLINRNGVPSEGTFININVGWSDWVEGSEDNCISSPSVISFSSSPTASSTHSAVADSILTRRAFRTLNSTEMFPQSAPPIFETAFINNRLDVFAKRVMNGDVWHKWWDGMEWSNWESLGGPVSSAPAAVSWGKNRIDLFARGMHNEAAHKWLEGNNWSNWENLGGPISSAPSATCWGANRIDLFARGMHNELAHKWWNGKNWSSWENLGGLLSSAPSAVSWGYNRIDCFALDFNNSVIHIWWDGSSWSNWEDLGGQFLSSPTASSFRKNRIDLFVINSENHLCHRWWDGNTWNYWEDLGGELAYAPAATSRGFNRIDVIGVNSKGNLMHKYWWK